MVTITYNIGAIFFLRRTFNRFSATIKTMHKDVSRLKLDTHRAINNMSANEMNILAIRAEGVLCLTQNLQEKIFIKKQNDLSRL